MACVLFLSAPTDFTDRLEALRRTIEGLRSRITERAVEDTVAAEPVPDVVPRGNIHPTMDLNGRIIRFVTGGRDNDFPLMHTALGINFYVFHDLIVENHRRIEEQFNVRLFIEWFSRYEMLQSQFALQLMTGEPIGDVVLLNDSMVQMLHLHDTHGALLTDLGGLSLPGSVFDLHGEQRFVTPALAYDGQIWQVDLFRYRNNATVLGVNLDILHSLGIPCPVSQFEEGSWNWDAFLQAMHMAAAAGYYGISGHYDWIAQGLIFANDGGIVNPDFRVNIDHPNTVAALGLFASLFVDELWYDCGREDWDWVGRLTNFTDGKSLFFPTATWVPSVADEPKSFDWAIVPFPKGPNNTSGNYGGRFFNQLGAVIPYGVENPAYVLMILEELLSFPVDSALLREEELRWPRQVFPTEADAQRMVDIASAPFTPNFGWEVGVRLFDFFERIARDVAAGTFTLYEIIEIERFAMWGVVDEWRREADWIQMDVLR